MAETAEEIAALLHRLRRERVREERLPPEVCGLGADDCDEAADLIDRQSAEIAELRAEVERLRAGGCARDQGLTQYCAEAAAFAAEVERLRAVAADQGSRLIRMRLALMIAREHGLKNRCWDGSVAVAITDWIDAGDAGKPIPWIDSPFFEQWAADNGISNVDGAVGYRAMMRPAPPVSTEQADG